MTNVKQHTKRRSRTLKTKPSAIPSTREIMEDCGVSETQAHRIKKRVIAEGGIEPLADAKAARKWQTRRWRAAALREELALDRDQKKLIPVDELCSVLCLAHMEISTVLQNLAEELPPRLAGKDAIDCLTVLHTAHNEALRRYAASFDKFITDPRSAVQIVVDNWKAKQAEAKLGVTEQNASVI